jgi:hypothetical protein
MKRPGRPKKVNKLDKVAKFWVTQQQFAIIQKKAAQANMNVAVFLRELSLKGQVIPRWTPEEGAMVREMIRISNDIHTMVETAKKEGAEELMRQFVEYRDKLDFAIDLVQGRK